MLDQSENWQYGKAWKPLSGSWAERIFVISLNLNKYCDSRQALFEENRRISLLSVPHPAARQNLTFASLVEYLRISKPLLS